MTEQQATVIGNRTQEQPRRLYRSTTNRSVAGVCAGLGEYFGIDVGIVRILWLLSVFVTAGASLLIYILLAVVIPEEPPEYAAHKTAPVGDGWQRISASGWLLWGVILVVAGALLLLDNFRLLPVRLGWIWDTFWSLLWPLLLIGLGVILLLNLSGRGIDWRQVRQAGASLPLRRSRRNRVLAGVCGGLGQQLNIDPVLVRLAWAVLSIMTAGLAGLLLYLLAALLIPLEEA